MKRKIITALMLLASVAAGAQTMSDALMFSKNNYYGTARSIALGNAMTALGGDMGSIGINPAGSAVAPYSQFTISPGISIMSNTTSYSSWVEEDFSNANKSSAVRMTMPNIGYTTTFDTYRNYGLLSYTIGFLSNTTSSFLDRFSGFGVNGQTSMLGSFAAAASPYRYDALSNTNNFYYSSVPWNSLIAYQSGMIAEAYDDNGNLLGENGNYTYLGATENMRKLDDGSYDISTMGTLMQRSRVKTIGSKQDLLFNAGFNFNNNLFLGVNLGVPMAEYRYDEFFSETAQNPNDFTINYSDGSQTQFKHAGYQYIQNTSMSGVYAKFGLIWQSWFGLRLGAAIQTPSALIIEDKFQVKGSTSYSNAAYDARAVSPVNEFTYHLTTPAVMSAGVAYSHPDYGLLSFDLEAADYGTMRFYDVDDFGRSSSQYSKENSANKNFAGWGLSARFGAEALLSPSFSLRAGYSFQNSPEFYRYDNDGMKLDSAKYLDWYSDYASGAYQLLDKERKSDIIQSFSLGFGYSSEKSFFADFVYRATSYSDSTFSPYSDYISSDNTYLPMLKSTSRFMSDIVLTLGFRF